MIESTSQKLQKAGVAEREARELVWRDAFDDCTIEQWYGLIKSLEEDKFWAGGKHRGDCTNDAFTCHRCIYDDIVKRAGPIAAFAARCTNEARLEALEQAARMVDRDRDAWKPNDVHEPIWSWLDMASNHNCMAAAIRALKAAPVDRDAAVRD